MQLNINQIKKILVLDHFLDLCIFTFVDHQIYIIVPLHGPGWIVSFGTDQCSTSQQVTYVIPLQKVCGDVERIIHGLEHFTLTEIRLLPNVCGDVGCIINGLALIEIRILFDRKVANADTDCQGNGENNNANQNVNICLFLHYAIDESKTVARKEWEIE